MMRTLRRHARDFALVVGYVVLGTTAIFYIVTHQDARPQLPWEERPFRLYAEFENSQGVSPGQGVSVRVAGVQIGLVDSVELHDGLARVAMDLEPEYADYVRRDATALLRPRTVLKDMLVEVDPGTPQTPPVPEEGTIPVGRTNPDVNTDEINASLDADTRAYLKILFQALGKGLDGRGGDLREVFGEFPPLHRFLYRVSKPFADNREQLARLVHNYRILTQELARKDEELTRFVVQSNRYFEATAPEENRIAAAVFELPSAVDRTTVALRKLARLARVSTPVLDALRPSARHLDDANQASLPVSREGTPIFRESVRPFVREAIPYIRTLTSGATGMATATPDLTASFSELNRLLNMLAYNPGGAEALSGDPVQDRWREEGYLYWLAWLAQNNNSTLSMADGQGVIRRTVALSSCDQIRASVADEPALEPLFGWTQILDDPGVCPR